MLSNTIPMNRERLLSYGYMFKELPPPFNSVEFGQKANEIANLPIVLTRCIDFSIPKGQYSRRHLQLPNPIGFFCLVNHICDGQTWSIIERHIFKSRFSHSKTFENQEAGANVQNKDNRAIQTNYDSVSESKEKTVIDAYDMLFELKIDISKYYPSIYTHSFVWALLGKKRAKQLWKMKPAVRNAEADSIVYDLADKLDYYSRNLQDGQSVGIPIGPDTSHILAEVIGSYIDQELRKEFPNVKAYRYFDDYTLYFDSEEEAYSTLKCMQQILSQIQLSLNENKTKIRRFPFEFQQSWVKEIRSVSINRSNSSNLTLFFSTLFGVANRHSEVSNTIFAYALKAFEKGSVRIQEKDWEIFESLLLKSMLVEPSVLESASRILETYRQRVDKDRLNQVLQKILNTHIKLNHNYEVVWVLWILKQFRLRLKESYVDQIVQSEDNFSVLLMLDLNKMGLVEGGLSESVLQSIADILDADLTANWLLYYQAVEIEKIVVAKKREGFKPFIDANISFYDTNQRIKIFE